MCKNGFLVGLYFGFLDNAQLATCTFTRLLSGIYIACKLGNISHFVDIHSAYAALTREAYAERISTK